MKVKRIAKSVTKSFELPPIQQKGTPIIGKNKKKSDKSKIVIKSEQVLQSIEEKAKDFDFTTQYEYVSMMEKKIIHLAEVFKISSGLALNLLIKNQYNSEACHVEAFEYQMNKNWMDVKRLFNLKEGLFNQICPICLQDTPPTQLIALNCNHKFCRTCFFNYLVSIMNDEGIFCFSRTCPMEGCKEYLTMEIFAELLMHDLKLLKQYQRYLSKFIIDTMPSNQKLCPQKNCSYIVTVNSDKITVVCPNNHHFCIKCLNTPHLPLTCKEFSFFNAASNLEELLDKNWIYTNAKPCPLCNTDIEKNKGCNHMTCKRCSHQFCWLCLRNWINHNNKFCAQNQKDLAFRMEQKKKSLNQKLRFLQEVSKMREKFLKNKENGISMKKHYAKLYSTTQIEKKITKEEFEEYLIFLTELESFLYLAENYSSIIEVNKFEKSKILLKVKEIYNKLVRINFSFKLLHNSISLSQICKTLVGIKTSSFNQRLFNQIKPLMNDVLQMTTEKNHGLNRMFD